MSLFPFYAGVTLRVWTGIHTGEGGCWCLVKREWASQVCTDGPGWGQVKAKGTQQQRPLGEGSFRLQPRVSVRGETGQKGRTRTPRVLRFH